MDDSNDKFIPVALINNSDGVIIDNYLKFSQGSKILIEVNFSPKRDKKVVDFKFFLVLLNLEHMILFVILKII